MSLFFWATKASCSSTYYLISHGSQDPYWTSLFQGAKAAANDLHIDLKILAPAGANDIPKQVQYLDSALATHPLGIATTLPSETAFSQSLMRAKAANIPVIAFDTKPQDQHKTPYLAYLGSDNEVLGKLAATKALDTGLLKDHVVILNPQPGHVGLEARVKGIKTILIAQHIIVDEIDVGTNASTVQAHVKSYFINNPNTSAIFCLTSQVLDPLGELILHASQNSFKFRPAIFSFDKTPNTLALIQKGIVSFAMDQQPFLIGYQSIIALVLLNKYHLIPININTVV